jgi:hypothetical protein
MVMTKDEKITKHLIDKMFEIAGHDFTYENLLGRLDRWYNENTMTQKQHDEWKEYSIRYIRKEKRMPLSYAERAFAWFDLSYGLKVEQPQAPDIDNIN